MAGGSFGYDRRRDDERLQNEAFSYTVIVVWFLVFVIAFCLLSSSYNRWDRAYFAMVWGTVVAAGSALVGKTMFWTYNFLRDLRSSREGP